MACEWFCRPAVNMLDLGAGSGVLSIAGAKLGCYRVLAREIDELAVRVCQENVDRNGVGEQVIVQHGGLEGLVTSARHFELGMANLTAKIILSLVPEGLQHVIYPYGKFIFSGIIDEQEEEVTEALAGIGLKKIGRRQTDDWVMLITQREAS
jgi:ribosomal protein L11 methyltransferase